MVGIFDFRDYNLASLFFSFRFSVEKRSKKGVLHVLVSNENKYFVMIQDQFDSHLNNSM